MGIFAGSVPKGNGRLRPASFALRTSPVSYTHLDVYKRQGLTVCDIAGKGLSAGIWQAHLMGLIRRCARRHADPAAAVAEVNAELCQDQDEPPIAALFFARLDPQENELVYCNAGLPPPLLLRRNKTVERLEKGGPMLGALQEAAYDSGSVRLYPGCLLYTSRCV